MTAAPTLIAEPEAETSGEIDLSRVTVVVGEMVVDVGVPTGASIAAVVDDVIALTNAELARKDSWDTKIDSTEGVWTLAPLAGASFDPRKSLDEVGAVDGDILVVRRACGPAASPLTDDLESTDPSADCVRGSFGGPPWMVGWFGCGTALCTAAALLVPRVMVGGVPVAALALLLAGIGCGVTAFTVRVTSDGDLLRVWLSVMAMILVFGGACHVVPGIGGPEGPLIALAMTSLFALAKLLGSQRGRMLYTALIGLAAFGVPAALGIVLLHPNPRTLGALSATTAIVVVYLAPRITIVLSGLPVPRVPTAGEPLDDIETHGGTAVEGVDAIGKQFIPTEEGMVDRVRRARDHLTGLVAAAAVVVNAGCFLALDFGDGFSWRSAAFAIALASVLCLRGRSHHDLAQSAVLIGGGATVVLLMLADLGTMVVQWQLGVGVVLLGLTILTVLCGLVAPWRDFTPVARRRVEILESIAVVMIFPLASSIIGLYTVFRGLRV